MGRFTLYEEMDLDTVQVINTDSIEQTPQTHLVASCIGDSPGIVRFYKNWIHAILITAREWSKLILSTPDQTMSF
jgi:hypothetical protein